MPNRITPRVVFVPNPNFLPAIGDIAGVRAARACDRVGERVKVLLNSGGTGEDVGAAGRRVSSPGDPPVSQSGDLAASQTTRGPITSGDKRIAASGSDEIKALFLQMGRANMEPRPYQFRALLDSRTAVLKSFEADKKL